MARNERLENELRDIAAALATAPDNERFKLLVRMDDILADEGMRAWWNETSGVGSVMQCGHPAATHFSFVCPRSWEGLAPTDAPNVRACDLCRERVYLVEDDAALLEHTSKGHCIALRIVYERDMLAGASRELATTVGRPKPLDGIIRFARTRTRE